MDSDEEFFNDENSANVESQLCKRAPAFHSNLPKIKEESMKASDISIQMNKTKDHLDEQSFDDDSCFSQFKHGASALKLINEDRIKQQQQLSFLRLPNSFVSESPTSFCFSPLKYVSEVQGENWKGQKENLNLCRPNSFVEAPASFEGFLSKSSFADGLGKQNEKSQFTRPLNSSENLQSIVTKAQGNGWREQKDQSISLLPNFTVEPVTDSLRNLQLKSKRLEGEDWRTQVNQSTTYLPSAFAQPPSSDNLLPVNSTELQKPASKSLTRNSACEKSYLTNNTPKKSLLSNAQKSFVDSPTFLECTTKGGCTFANFLKADRSLLYFGFRPLDSESEDSLTLTNVSDQQVQVKYSITPRQAANIFKLPYSSIYTIGPQKKHFIRVIFCPAARQRYKARITLTLTVGEDVVKTSINVFGFGGQARVTPVPLESESKRTLTISASGRYQLFPHSINSFRFALQNNGTRDAFVFIVLQDNNSEELPAEHAMANPTSFIIGKSGASQEVEVRLFSFPNMCGSRNSIAGSQRSLTSAGLFSRPCSAMESSASTVSQVPPPAFRILAFWGEQHQRKRVKCFESNMGGTKFIIMNRHLSWKLDGDVQEDSKESLLSYEDYRICKACIRYNLIEVVSRKRNVFSRNTTARTGMSNTLVDMDPDDTLKVYESLCETLTA